MRLCVGQGRGLGTPTLVLRRVRVPWLADVFSDLASLDWRCDVRLQLFHRVLGLGSGVQEAERCFVTHSARTKVVGAMFGNNLPQLLHYAAEFV